MSTATLAALAVPHRTKNLLIRFGGADTSAQPQTDFRIRPGANTHTA